MTTSMCARCGGCVERPCVPAAEDPEIGVREYLPTDYPTELEMVQVDELLGPFFSLALAIAIDDALFGQEPLWC